MTTIGEVAPPVVDGCSLGNARVLIVDDHGLVAESLRLTLRSYGYEARSVVQTTVEAILAAVSSHRPHIVLLDLDLGACDGLNLVAPIVAAGARVVIVTGQRDRLRLSQCLEAGASGFAQKDEPVSSLVGKVAATLRGEEVVPVAYREQLMAELRSARRADAERLRPLEQLTRREREVLAALIAGHRVSVIAGATYTSEATVRGHVNAILRKLGVSSQLAAVAMARSNEWPLEDPLAS